MTLKDYTFLDGWRLRETAWKPEEESAKATVFALANGYMGSRGAFEEADPTEPGVVGNYINGIYDTPLGKLTEREIVNIPDWHSITLDLGDESFSLADLQSRPDCQVTYWRELDMREGVLRRFVQWDERRGGGTLMVERFLSMARPHLAAIRYTLTVEGMNIVVDAGIRAGVSSRWAEHAAAFQAMARPGRFHTQISTRDPGYEVAVALSQTTRPDGAYRQYGPSFDTNDHSVVSETHAGHGDTVELTEFAAVYDSRFTHGRLEDACEAALDQAEAMGYDALKAEHVARWAELWDKADVVIEGDDDAQLGIRFSIFHILAASPWWSDRVSIPARGLQGQDYYGSIFWDCEIFCLPMLMASHPEAARNALGYRYHTLNGARRKANNYGFDGAFYAWQSQETGDDQCALYVFTNPFTGRPMRAPFSDQQVHISADIVYALWEYFLATLDWEFIWDRGLEICFEVARFFATRCERDPDGSYHLRGVLGPDEYHESVDDDAYTNLLVRRAFGVTMHFLSVARLKQPERLAALQAKIRLTDEEITAWGDVWQGLTAPAANEGGVIEQFAGYFDLEDAPVEEVRARLAHPDLHPGGPLGPFQSTQIIKQADVVMMLYLLRDEFSRDVKAANWAYYEQRTAHDSSLSPMAYSLVAADVGLTEYAYRYFIQTAHIDLASYGPHWNLGIHAAGLGGAWMALVHGFCQISRGSEELVFRAMPELPEQWKRVAFQYVHLGQRVAVEVTPAGVTLRHVEGSEPLDVEFSQARKTLAPGGEVSYPRGLG